MLGAVIEQFFRIQTVSGLIHIAADRQGQACGHSSYSTRVNKIHSDNVIAKLWSPQGLRMCIRPAGAFYGCLKTVGPYGAETSSACSETRVSSEPADPPTLPPQLQVTQTQS